MGPVTGEILANLVTGGPQKFDLNPLKANRFWRLFKFKLAFH